MIKIFSVKQYSKNKPISNIQVKLEPGPDGYKYVGYYKDPDSGEEKKKTLAKYMDVDDQQKAMYKATIAKLKMEGKWDKLPKLQQESYLNRSK